MVEFPALESRLMYNPFWVLSPSRYFYAVLREATNHITGFAVEESP